MERIGCNDLLKTYGKHSSTLRIYKIKSHITYSSTHTQDGADGTAYTFRTLKLTLYLSSLIDFIDMYIIYIYKLLIYITQLYNLYL